MTSVAVGIIAALESIRSALMAYRQATKAWVATRDWDWIAVGTA